MAQSVSRKLKNVNRHCSNSLDSKVTIIMKMSEPLRSPRARALTKYNSRLGSYLTKRSQQKLTNGFDDNLLLHSAQSKSLLYNYPAYLVGEISHDIVECVAKICTQQTMLAFHALLPLNQLSGPELIMFIEIACRF